MPGLTLRGSLRFGKQSAHTLLGFVLLGALLALMLFWGLAGLGAGDFPFGFGGLLRLVRPVVRFLSWMVLCCSCSLSSHCWEAMGKHDCQVHLTPLCYSTDIRTNDISPHRYILITTIVVIATLHCWALIMYQRLMMRFGHAFMSLKLTTALLGGHHCHDQDPALQGYLQKATQLTDVRARIQVHQSDSRAQGPLMQHSYTAKLSKNGRPG